MISKILRVALASGLALSLAGAVPAHANDGDVIRRGNCSGSSDWKLKLSPEDGRIEVEFEVDSNVAGQTWQVRLTKNGNQIFSGYAGDPRSQRLLRASPRDVRPEGDDVFRARATHAGEVCAGRATF